MPITPTHLTLASFLNEWLVRMHGLRHGWVSVLIGLGVPPRTLMEIAGHSDLEMMMSVYARVCLDDKQAVFEKLNALFEDAWWGANCSQELQSTRSATSRLEGLV